MPDGVNYRLEFDKPVDFNPDAEAYIYVLRLESVDNSEYYYVGQTINIIKRLKMHGSKNGDIDQKPANVEFNNVEVVDVESFSKFLETDGKFMDRVLNREREKAFEVARAYDTNNVLGGK